MFGYLLLKIKYQFLYTMNLSYKCVFMITPDEKTMRRLSCGRDFNLDDILYNHKELDLRSNMPTIGDVIPVLGGIYHVEVTENLDKTYMSIFKYAEGTSGIHRVQSFMKFISKYVINDYSENFKFEFYRGKVLNLGNLLENGLVNSMDAAVLLAFMINRDYELKADGFRAHCVSGHTVNWWGEIKHTVMAVKLDTSQLVSYLAIPSLNKLKEISFCPLTASRDFGVVEAYQTESHRLLMFGEYSPMFRKNI